MKTTKISLIIFLTLTFSNLIRAQDCDIWLDNMATEIENNNTGEAVKAMKWFVNCKGNELGLENPVIKNLDKIAYISRFDNGYALCSLKDGNYAVTNKDFTEIHSLGSNADLAHILAPPYQFSDGRLSFSRVDLKKNKIFYGFLDYKGNEVIPADKYNLALPFEQGISKVFMGNLQKMKGKWGAIDVNGNEIIPLKYDRIPASSEGFVMVFDKKGAHLFNPKGEELHILDDYETSGLPSEGMIAVYKNNHWGYINMKGEILIPLTLEFEVVNSFHSGMAIVQSNGKYGFINKKGETIASPKYEMVSWFRENRAMVKQDGKWGFIDTEGNEITPLKYELVYYFDHGAAPVKLNGKWGLINASGEEITSLKYEDMNQIEAGKMTAIFERISDIAPSFLLSNKKNVMANMAQLNGKWGVVDNSGNEITPFMYDYFSFLPGMIMVSSGIQTTYIDENGKCVKNCE